MGISLKRLLLLIFFVTVYFARTVEASAAAPYCSPTTNAARILTQPSPNAIHPDWQGNNFIGTAWTLSPKRTVSNVTGVYAFGDLRSGSSGGIVNRNVYILLSEWRCEGFDVPKVQSQSAGPSGTPAVSPQATAQAQPNVQTQAAPGTPVPASGNAFRDCDKCPEIVALSPGRFQMGASAKETRTLQYVAWALPQHGVTIGYPFAIGRYEVTVDEFDAYVKETGARVGGVCAIRLMEVGKLALKYTGTRHPDNNADANGPFVVVITDGSYAQPGLPVTGRQPATCVSRNEIMGYLDWLGKKTGHRYRLPTEAEWEYAYRAGTDTINFWGDDFVKTCDYANFGDRNSGYQAGMMAPCGEKIRPDWTAEVGRYKPNPWGLYDMAGNVQETVEDCFHTSYNGAPADGSPWKEEGCLLFVARGGDYELPHVNIRASERLFFGYVREDRGNVQGKDAAFNSRSNAMGFRVARSLSDAAWDHAK